MYPMLVGTFHGFKHHFNEIKPNTHVMIFDSTNSFFIFCNMNANKKESSCRINLCCRFCGL